MAPAELLAAKRDVIEKVAWRFARRGMEIDDARQVATIAAWKVLGDDRYEHGNNVDGLIASAAYRALQDEIRSGRVTGVKRGRHEQGDQPTLSLNRPVGGNDEYIELIDRIVDERAGDAHDALSDAHVVARAMEILPERQRFIVYLYFFEELTQEEIGELLGISNSRVSQLLTASFRKMKPMLALAAA